MSIAANKVDDLLADLIEFLLADEVPLNDGLDSEATNVIRGQDAIDGVTADAGGGAPGSKGMLNNLAAEVMLPNPTEIAEASANTQKETRSIAELGRDAIDRAGSITTTQQLSGDTGRECNRS